jgi:hypothetical protein
MSIDGIGRSGPPPGIGAATEVQVGGTAELGSTTASSGAVGSEALAQLQRGEITLPQYLDATVQQAVQHLGQLPAEQLDFVRTELRRQLETDPALLELVRRTTGQAPTVNDG